MTETMDASSFKAQIFDFDASNDFKFVGPLPIILNFHAEWCGPCHAFGPTLEQISEDYAGKLKIFKVDIDKCPELPALFGVRSVPTTVFFAPNEEPALASGAMPEESMEHAIRDLFKLEKNSI